MNVVGAPEAMVIIQLCGGGGVLVEPERDLRLYRAAEAIIPGRGAGGAGGVQVNIDLGARARGGTVDDLAWEWSIIEHSVLNSAGIYLSCANPRMQPGN